MKFIVAGLLALSLNSYAADQTVNSNTVEFTKEYVDVAPQGFIPFLGFNGGYTGHNNSVPVEGTPVSLKLLGSYYMELPYVFDAGYGISNQQTTQSGALRGAETGSSLELAARYRFANNWQAGVVANQLFNMGSVYAASQGDAQFAGLQVLKEFAMGSGWLARVGGRAMTETNNTGKMVNMYMIDLQIGWNPNSQVTTVKPVVQVTTPAPVAKTIDYKPTPAFDYLNYASFENGNSIFFQESSYKIEAKNQADLKKLAALLKKNKNLYSQVEVHGYADISGTESLNQTLSTKRANQVKDMLVKGGMNKNNIVAVGKGAATESNQVLAQDRKVEILFTGVKDEKALKKALAL